MVFEAVHPGVGGAGLLPCLYLGLLPPVRPQPDRGPRPQNAQVGYTKKGNFNELNKKQSNNQQETERRNKNKYIWTRICQSSSKKKFPQKIFFKKEFVRAGLFLVQKALQHSRSGNQKWES